MSEKFIENELYKMIVESIPIPTVDVLPFNEDLSKVLLFSRNNEPARGIYYSLGGRICKGEGLVECARRKLKEEIGIDVFGKELVEAGVISETFPNSSYGEDVSSHFINVYYGVILDEDPEIRLDSQHSRWKWMDVGDEMIIEFMKEKIRKSREALKRSYGEK